MLIKTHLMSMEIGGTTELIAETSVEKVLFYIDANNLIKDEIKLVGWCIDPNFMLPPISVCALDVDRILAVARFVPRPDVAKAFGCEIDMFGFELSMRRSQLLPLIKRIDLVAIMHTREFAKFHTFDVK